ncbi:MAG: MurR/RpiR family transcriptional regulator [Firmicutes bacterium]|jgi:DNA-binding MurR/RpiR family transcriptional regulator|nr:MurR/RpiR family transcriptional regulator [Oscillospiraceae bacterium]MDD6247053.1 MurR/RpiR family transcriptional regulator [Bacillota bacterium]MDY2807424.1 MurR/RpiR family transcriptional regulator [Oscillospiraceae bacterium]CDB88072.1 sIS domain protein [Firmicutes bacterium CAG:170]
MASDILTTIHDQLRTFSKGQKLIANYILQSYDKAAFMTASRLGKTVGVSESTVVRFAVELGFDGYPSMQRTLQELVRNKLTSVQRIEVANDRIGNQDVVSTVLQADIDTLRKTSETLDRREMNESVELILQAKRIYIIGVRSSTAIADFLNFYFRNIFENVSLVSSTSTSEMFEQMLRVGKGDVVIGISLPRYSSRTVKTMQYAKDCGAATIAITDKPDAPAGKLADHVLVAKSDMVSIVDSLVAPMSVVNALIVAVSRRREEQVSTTFKNLERLWDEYDVYERVE